MDALKHNCERHLLSNMAWELTDCVLFVDLRFLDRDMYLYMDA
jgi:hypothetical protein